MDDGFYTVLFIKKFLYVSYYYFAHVINKVTTAWQGQGATEEGEGRKEVRRREELQGENWERENGGGAAGEGSSCFLFACL